MEVFMETITKQEISVFGYEIIRDHVLSNILGKHENEILYWAGKDLARKFPLYSMDEALQFFQEAGWGQLTVLKESKDEVTYILKETSTPLQIENRCFRLEAGFLAAQKERNLGFLTECYEEKNPKQNIVTFKLKSDLKEPIQKD
jgi:predicted hydrocarbon binding protein